MTKWIFVPLIAAIFAIDLLALLLFIVQPQYAAVLFARLRMPSECALSELLREAKVAKEAAQSAGQPRLERSEEGLDLWNTQQGKIWTIHGDSILSFLLDEQLRDIYELPGHEIGKGDIVLDCGANIGIFTRTALARGASLVVAIEPAPQTLKAFRRNLETEIRQGRVIVYPKGAWDHDAEMDLNIDEINQAANTLVTPVKERMSKVRVPLTTIDKIVAELKLTRVDFIKMDIEGAEKPALKGAENTIKRFRPRMSLSSEHLADDFTAIPALVRSLEPSYRYRGCDCDIRQRRLKALVLAFDPAS